MSHSPCKISGADCPEVAPDEDEDDEDFVGVNVEEMLGSLEDMWDAVVGVLFEEEEEVGFEGVEEADLRGDMVVVRAFRSMKFWGGIM